MNNSVTSRLLLTGCFALLLPLTSAEPTSAQQNNAATATGSSARAAEQATISAFRLSYYLPAWRTLHLHDADKAKEQLATLNGLSTPSQLMVDASLWKLDELAHTRQLQPKQRERLLTLQKTLYDQPRLTVDRFPPN